MSIANTNPHSFPASSLIDAPLACRIGALEQQAIEMRRQIVYLTTRIAELEKGNFKIVNVQAGLTETLCGAVTAYYSPPVDGSPFGFYAKPPDSVVKDSLTTAVTNDLR